MKKTYLMVIILIIILPACNHDSVSEGMVRTAIMQTNNALVPTVSNTQITDAMIQTAIAETQTLKNSQEHEPSNVAQNTLNPLPTRTYSELVGDGSQETQDTNLVGYTGDVLNNEIVAVRIYNIEYPSNYDLYELKEEFSVVKFEAEFANISKEKLWINFDNIYIIDNDGYKYRVQEAVTDYYGVNLLPNDKVRSYFYGQIPSQTTPTIIKYMGDNFSTIQVNLNQIPSNHTPLELSLSHNKNSEPLGTVAEADGYKAFAISIDNPFNEGSTYSGYKNIRVEWSLENATSNTDLVFDSVLSDIYLVDSEGYIYPLDWDLGIWYDGLDDFILAKGEKVKGYIFFRIFKEAKPSYIRYGNLYIGLN